MRYTLLGSKEILILSPHLASIRLTKDNPKFVKKISVSIPLPYYKVCNYLTNYYIKYIL